MEHTVYLTFDQDDVPINLYSVKLASENPSDAYGILNVTTGAAAVAWGTTVTPYTTGTYSYTFTVENANMYFVSWEIVANAGEDPTYKTDQVGPFFSVDNRDIRATSSYSGKFIQGFTTTLMIKITNFDGIAKDAESISLAIYDENSSAITLSHNVPEHVTLGYYVYDWAVDSDQAAGEYTIVWNYVVDDITKAEIQRIIIATDATDTAIHSGRALEFRLALEHHLHCAQTIPIYYEQSKPTRDNKTFRFSFNKWNQSAGTIVYRNENIVNEGVEIDYFDGKVVFDTVLSSYETVNVDYNFKWFSEDELNRFLLNALQTVNVYPPHSGYDLLNVPDRFTPIVIYGAAKDALRHLMMCLQFQQPAQVFGGLENAQKAFANFETLKQNYEKDWEKLLEQKKYGPYPTTRLVVTPEYTLPGGRSRWFRYLFKG